LWRIPWPKIGREGQPGARLALSVFPQNSELLEK